MAAPFALSVMIWNWIAPQTKGGGKVYTIHIRKKKG